MSKTIIASVVLTAYCIGLVVAISSVNNELKYVVENRPLSGATIEVKPAKRYEDCLQCSAGGRNVQNTIDGKQLQNGQTATRIDEVTPRAIIKGEF